MYLSKDEGIAGWVVANNKPAIIADVVRDERFSKKVDNISGFQTRSILAVPLRIEGEKIGVIEVVNKKYGDNYDIQDIHMLTTIANFRFSADKIPRTCLTIFSPIKFSKIVPYCYYIKNTFENIYILITIYYQTKIKSISSLKLFFF